MVTGRDAGRVESERQGVGGGPEQGMDENAPKPAPGRRLERNLGLLALALLLVGCLVVLRPFISGLLWAVGRTLTRRSTLLQARVWAG